MDKRVGIGKPHRDGEEQRNSEGGTPTLVLKALEDSGIRKGAG